MRCNQPTGRSVWKSLAARLLPTRTNLTDSSVNQRVQTRERILEAAELVFADNGYHEALVDEIGKRTSMSKGGLYFHFPSKEDLFFAVMDRLANKLVKRAEKAAAKADSPVAAAEAALGAVVMALSRQKRLARLLVTRGYSMGNAFESKRSEIFNRFAEVIRLQLDEAVEAGQIDQLDTDLASRVWLGAVNETVVHWLFSGGRSPSETVSELRAILVASIGGNRLASSPAAGSQVVAVPGMASP